MPEINWSEGKNKLLKQTRNISFEQIIEAISNKQILDILPHPNQKQYKNQKIMLIKYNNYVYVVPFIEDKNKLFLKTIFASRQYTKKYLKRRAR